LEQFGRHCRVAVRKVSRAGFDFVFPPVCAWCGGTTPDRRDVKSTGFEATFCDECQTSLAPEIEQSCPRCGAPIGPYLNPVNGCIHCRTDRFAFDQVVSLGVYGGLLHHACLRCKRPDGDVLAGALGGLLYERHAAVLSAAEIDVVIPIPRYWLHRITRPHNPAETLARVLARRSRTKFSRHLLLKVRRTPNQTELPPSSRRTNLVRAFRVRRAKSLAGRTVLLVDDILTTGATSNEAARLLVRAGAKRVLVAVVARGLGASSRA